MDVSFFARLFGRNRRGPEHLMEASSDVAPVTTLADTGESAINLADMNVNDPHAIDAALQRALSPVVMELQILRRMLGAIEHSNAANEEPSTRQSGALASTGATGDREIIERAIENALAHFYQLLRGREEFKTQPVFLTPTSDGNTALPLDPMLQHLLVVMHPLYPHMYTTLIVLPGTFTRVDRLNPLPNGVRVHSLHINERKAAPGFMAALRALHQENSENLFLGKLTPTPTPGGPSQYQLEYFRCTGSPIRNPDTEQFPGEQMMFFNDVPEPLIFRQHMNGVEDVFSALRRLTESAAAPSQASSQDEATSPGA